MKQLDFDNVIKKTFDKKVNRDATTHGENFMKYNSMNDAEKEVFLGGTCNGSEWRDAFIKDCIVPCFNPVVEDWNDAAQAAEVEAKLRCGIHLYVITPLMEGTFSIAEAVESAIVNPKGTVFVICLKDGSFEFTPSALKSLTAVAGIISKYGGSCHTVPSIDKLGNVAKGVSSIKRGFASTLIVQIQSHPHKFGGIHGVQVTYDFINLARGIIQFFNDKIGSVFNMAAIKSLKDAKEAQEGRTDDRKSRKVEGYDKN